MFGRKGLRITNRQYSLNCKYYKGRNFRRIFWSFFVPNWQTDGHAQGSVLKVV